MPPATIEVSPKPATPTDIAPPSPETRTPATTQTTLGPLVPTGITTTDIAPPSPEPRTPATTQTNLEPLVPTDITPTDLTPTDPTPTDITPDITVRKGKSRAAQWAEKSEPEPESLVAAFVTKARLIKFFEGVAV
ncbi:hypothetical protein QBC39DRAFT_376862 [Podospora conica]|nr:hypothetical protein QBC39DRAFT_376862 [Schizothecium conicum]